MRTNLEYLRGMLLVFLDAETPCISVRNLAAAGYDITSTEGLHHYPLLIEQGFVSTAYLVTHEPALLGYDYQNYGVLRNDSAVVRLTAGGLEFAEALQQQDIFDRLKGIGNQPIGILKDVGTELLKAYLKKRLGLSG